MNVMQHILHDFSVWRWAFSRRHPLAQQTRLEILWPVAICRHAPAYAHRAWIVHLQRPRLFILNAYRLELEYLLSQSIN